MKRLPAFFVAALLSACAGINGQNPHESKLVLDRTEVAAVAKVKHVLIAWSWLGSSYRRMGLVLDPRAEARNEGQADELAEQLLQRCIKGEPFEALMKEYSEDEGSAQTGLIYTVDEATRMVEPFKDLSRRLKAGECGLVRSQFGWHVIKRFS